MEKVDIAIVGAGVIGLAIARELSRHYSHKTIVVLERHSKYGQETSGRNSEVIHSGIYYPSHMLKTSLCIAGNPLLYEYCEKYRIPHRKIGKLIVAATEDDVSGLDRLIKQAQLNNIAIEKINAAGIKSMEPDISAVEGIFIRHTGIFDSHTYLSSLYYLGRENGVYYLFNTALLNIDYDGKGYIIETQREKLKAEVVINTAGLFSDKIAQMAGIDIDKAGYRLHPCKGEYYKINRRFNINHLVYPIPDRYGLGIHLTKDISGGLRLGPNTYYVDEPDYSMDERHKEEFYAAARRYLPFLKISDISPDYCGDRKSVV